jgi:predicted Rossmann fold nucleotide-binding protein DprA/Smf involved in DNA uptake
MAKTSTTKTTTTKAPKSTKATKTKETTIVKVTPIAEPAKEAPTKDKFGCRLESQASKINAAITSKPKTPATIAEETGLDTARVRAHLKHLLGKELVVETEEGFKAKK